MISRLIKGLLDYYDFPKTVDHHNTSGQIIEVLLDRGLLEEKPSSDIKEGDAGYRVSEKGKVYLEAVQAVPMPEPRWFVPTS